MIETHRSNKPIAIACIIQSKFLERANSVRKRSALDTSSVSLIIPFSTQPFYIVVIISNRMILVTTLVENVIDCLSIP